MKKISSFVLASVLACNISGSVFAENTENTTENVMQTEENIKYTQTHAVNAEYVSDWAREYISKAREISLISNEPENFSVPITREKFCEYVYNLIMCKNRGITTPESTNKFTDTDNEKVHTLNHAGIINGKSETEFKPDDFLTREEAATIIIRMINREMPMEVTEMFFEYDDISDVSEWASEAVQVISNFGFMLGTGENKFEPQGTYTAEQAIATLVRIYEAKTYVYQTPLGTIETESNYDSHINFAVKCDAVIGMAKNAGDDTQNGFMIEKPVKALTDQTTSVLISFDDFAQIFGGEWKLTDGKFEFNYDPEKEVEVVKWQDLSDGETREWQNKTDAVPVIQFYSGVNTIIINGEEREILSSYGGRIFNSCITMHEGVLYIPVYMVAQLLGYESAGLQIIYQD